MMRQTIHRGQNSLFVPGCKHAFSCCKVEHFNIWGLTSFWSQSQMTVRETAVFLFCFFVFILYFLIDFIFQLLMLLLVYNTLGLQSSCTGMFKCYKTKTAHLFFASSLLIYTALKETKNKTCVTLSFYLFCFSGIRAC